MLGMQDISDALIGVPGAGLNLEQRKRVSMGIDWTKEIADCPSNPEVGSSNNRISGFAASSIPIEKKLSRSGQTILCTIHQPAAAVIEAFDNLILLAKGQQNQIVKSLDHGCGRLMNGAQNRLARS
jgi:ATP-binding cassette subfamily G (WHITE) protein 2 (SNQ2)